MRQATENRRDSRTIAEYFSPRNKGKDLALQQRPLPHIASFRQETPMKPSQIPNQLSHPPPRRVLPLQSPELYHRDRLGPRRFSPHALGPVHSSGRPTYVGTPANRPHHMPWDRLGWSQHSAPPPRSFCSSHPVPVSPFDSKASAKMPQPWPSGTEPTVTLSPSSTKNVTTKIQEPNKAQSSDVRSPIPTVQLYRAPGTPSINTGAVQGVYPQPPSDPEHCRPRNSHSSPRGYQPSSSTKSSDRCNGSSLPIMHNRLAPCKDQQHKRTPSSKKSIPVVDLNCSSQKRRREFEDCDDNAGKRCFADANSGKAKTPKPNSVKTSLVLSPKHSSALGGQRETTNNKMACGESSCLELSFTFKPTESPYVLLSPKHSIKGRPSNGVKQAFILEETKSSSKPVKESLKKGGEENNNRNRLGTVLSPEVPERLNSSSPHVHRRTSVSPVKTLSRKTDGSTSKSASKPHSGFLSCRASERNKTARLRRPAVIPYDTDELFTPDPTTYVVGAAQKNAKPKTDGGPAKSLTSEKSCSPVDVIRSSTAVTGSLCRKSQNTVSGRIHAEDSKASSTASNLQLLSPTVALERVKLENITSLCSKDGELKNSRINFSGRQHVKCETALLPNNVTLEADTAAPEQTSTSHCSQSPLLETEASEWGRKQVNEEDSIDVELDLDLSFALDLDMSQSSQSSEDEQLLSLQEMMERVTKPPDTPEKEAFSEPSTPRHHSSKLRTQPLPSTTKPGHYKNNLDQILKEMDTIKKAKEIEMQLLNTCKEDLLRIAEYEEAEEKQEEGISSEQQEFLQRYSLMSSAIREVPPGETVFNMEKFGQIFNQDTLQLRQCRVTPQGTAQKTLLWSSPAQLRLHVIIGLFQEAYDCQSPCPARITRFLFKMMSVHSERLVSEKMLQALCDIARTAAYQIVKSGSQQFEVWVPSLADVALVLMNMGVAFVTLFPFENLQPPFTEGDLLEDVYIKSESPSSKTEQSTVPEHNYNNILKYLSFCMSLCPRAYSDDELLFLLTVVGRVSLDTQLILQSSVELFPLQYKIVNNVRDWDTVLPRICLALTDLTDDHHNMCLLVQMLPDNTRGKQLRRHLSLSMISKLLDGKCTYRPTGKEFQLSKLRPYLPCMQPSTLLRGMLSSSSRSQRDKAEDMATQDQKSYYLCYSLLTLTNEASNFQLLPAHQKEQLLCLCSELETHVKCDIRESEKCLYRSKVKDLVARIYTKWQMMLQKIRPLNGKLYDYWQPPPVDTLVSSQEERGMDSSDDGEAVVLVEKEQEEDTNEAGENEVVLFVEEEEEEKKKEGRKGHDPEHDKSQTEDAIEPFSGEPNEKMQEMQPVVHECTEADDLVHTRGTSHQNRSSSSSSSSSSM
ncbi:SMC5-SMC6 complex localization factor protein 2 isoform X1 [Scophthalmus maximus]|uniref:SMC5-SMC6 complex localization factor protein 2 isoform X1 n=2 Tax=Scophthalmus maximus TaxID=52904 RepID=UPI001FA93027|nr:SMC5-SMC6 complex localization factor protein 2 isoform X1 [Scophthalmus maximus]